MKAIEQYCRVVLFIIIGGQALSDLGAVTFLPEKFYAIPERVIGRFYTRGRIIRPEG